MTGQSWASRSSLRVGAALLGFAGVLTAVDAVSGVERHHAGPAGGEGRGVWREYGVRSEGLTELAPRRQRIERDHLTCAVRLRHLHGNEPGRAEPANPHAPAANAAALDELVERHLHTHCQFERREVCVLDIARHREHVLRIDGHVLRVRPLPPTAGVAPRRHPCADRQFGDALPYRDHLAHDFVTGLAGHIRVRQRPIHEHRFAAEDVKVPVGAHRYGPIPAAPPRPVQARARGTSRHTARPGASI